MDTVPTERDSRLVDLLDQALTELRAGRPMETATWQAHAPDLAEDLPALLETMRDLDTAARTWRGDRTLASEPTAGAEAAPPLELPARVGRYEILARLGAGGMGCVYKARDPDLGRVVAVKVPHFNGSADVRVQRKARFLREARAAATVHHPHICPIHDVGEEDGLPYVVMAFIEGRSLAERLRTQGCYDDQHLAVDLVRQVAAALEAIHAHGIVHRDLKPGNILLDSAETFAHLADFGLARPGDSAEPLTLEGELVGTPAYMAAEQATGAVDKVGPWTDVYSLGVVLYQMLTGRLPFEGPTTLSVLHKVASETAPAPSQFRSDLDPGLEAIVQKALARQPEDRYRTARDLAEALEQWASLVSPVLGAASTPAPTHTASIAPAATLVADAPPPTETREQTVVLSGLPDGQSLKLSLPAGTKADVKVTMTEGARGKRKKKRPWRVTVSISLSVAGLLLATGLALYLNRANENQSFVMVGSEIGVSRMAAKKADETPKQFKATPTLVCLQIVEARPEGEVVSEVLAQIKGNELVAELPRYLKNVPDGPQAVVMRLPDRTSLVVKGKLHEGRLVAPWSRALPVRTQVESKGLARKRWENLKHAEVISRNTIQLHPEIATSHNNLGLILTDRGKLAEAVAAYRKAIALRPNYAEAYTNLANALRQQGKLAEAEATYREALRLKPDSPEVHCQLGDALASMGRSQEAMARYQQALRLKPNNPQVYFSLATILNEQRRPREAAVYYQKALKLLGLPRNAEAVILSQPASLRQQGGPQGMHLDEPAVTVRLRRVDAVPRTRQDAAASAALVGLLKGQGGLGPHLTALALVDRVGRGEQPPVPLLDRAVVRLAADEPRPEAELVQLPTGKLQVRRVSTGRILLTLSTPAAPITDVALSTDGKRLALGEGNGVVQLWDVKQKKQVLALQGHTGRVNTVRFSPDGKTLASAAADRTVKVWEVASGKEIRNFAAHRAAVTAVAFSPDGKLVVTAGKDGQARLWDAASGKPLAITPWAARPLADARFSHDGRWLMTNTDDGRIGVWAIPAGKKK